jgi:hypothetical protein
MMAADERPGVRLGLKGAGKSAVAVARGERPGVAVADAARSAFGTGAR